MQLSIYCVLSAVCWWRVALQHATSTHTPQDRHLTTPRTPYAVYVRNLTSSAPEDGRVSPKHVELKVCNKYSIALSW